MFLFTDTFLRSNFTKLISENGKDPEDPSNDDWANDSRATPAYLFFDSKNTHLKIIGRFNANFHFLAAVFYLFTFFFARCSASIVCAFGSAFRASFTHSLYNFCSFNPRICLVIFFYWSRSLIDPPFLPSSLFPLVTRERFIFDAPCSPSLI